MKNRFLLCFVLTIAIPFRTLANDSLDHKRPQVISMKTAIQRNMLEIRISGSYDPRQYYEVADKDGVHYGKCMDAILKSRLDNTVLIKLESGTLLIPDDDSVQKMLVTKDILFPLFPNRIYRTRFYAMCSQMHLKSPFFITTFKVGDFADTSLVKLAKYIDSTYNQNMVAQHAVWAFTDKATTEDLIKYGGDSNSIRQSIAILNAIHLETPLNTPLPLKQPITTQSITLSSYWVYGGLGLIGVLALTTLVFAVRKNINSHTMS